MHNTTFTAVLYDGTTVSARNQKVCDTPDEAIVFARTNGYDIVVNDETGETIWRKGDMHTRWPKARFAVKEPGKDVNHLFTTAYRATKFAKERGYPDVYDEYEDAVIWRNPDV